MTEVEGLWDAKYAVLKWIAAVAMAVIEAAAGNQAMGKYAGKVAESSRHCLLRIKIDFF